MHTRETVEGETPASAAISLMVTATGHHLISVGFGGNILIFYLCGLLLSMGIARFSATNGTIGTIVFKIYKMKFLRLCIKRKK